MEEFSGYKINYQLSKFNIPTTLHKTMNKKEASKKSEAPAPSTNPSL